EDGCIFYNPCTDVDMGNGINEDSVTIVECWESPEHLKAHLAAPHMKKFIEDVRDMRVSSSLSVVTPA
ncbi:MAG: antibiotic biosynthesis monooxygenase, partial [Lentisphaeria bacterium]|nr:antibiotic biosynthesis monooxygenase [Lentisphaeria bacterium]